MKRLTCEMCGSTDLVKQEGLFVCQTCGCKYSVEEAKKMMIEGTVEVTGTVKVDKSVELENLYTLADRALKEKNFESAENYYDSILRLNPNDARANFYKSYCRASASRAMDWSTNYQLTANTAISSIGILAGQEPTDFKMIEKIFEETVLLGIQIMDAKIASFFENPEILFYRTQDISARIAPFQNFMLDYMRFEGDFLTFISRAMTPRDDISNIPTAHMLETAQDGISARNKLAASVSRSSLQIGLFDPYSSGDEFAQKANVILSKAEPMIRKRDAQRKRKEQEERAEKYWAEHAEEKEQLESERESLNATLADLKQQSAPLDNEIRILRKKREEKVQSELEKDKIMDELSGLRKEQEGLGRFKGKEKKALQDKMDELKARIAALETVIKAERDALGKECDDKIRGLNERLNPIKAQIGTAQKRLNEIQSELNRGRQ